MDFGLAKMVSDGTGLGMLHQTTETAADFAVGTPGYISPEQVRGDAVDFRCDLYSVGVLLFELLTGRLPFTRTDTMDVLFAHATEPPPSFTEVGAAGWVPRAVEKVVMRCLAKNPADRPGSARDLAQEYQDALLLTQERGSAATPTPAEGFELSPGEEAPEEEAAEGEGVPAREALPDDPFTVVHRMQAWMPDTIATYKLRGFVHDHDGEVLESVPGKIRVRLGGPKSVHGRPSGFSWFGLRKTYTIVDMELRLERSNPQQQSQLHITVLMSSPDRKVALSPGWRDRCDQIYCELRSYLAGASVGN
jgi:serine/threonine-protein kinase